MKWLIIAYTIAACGASNPEILKPDPCPVRCKSGYCCQYDEICTGNMKCAWLGPFAPGMSPDAGR